MEDAILLLDDGRPQLLDDYIMDSIPNRRVHVEVITKEYAPLSEVINHGLNERAQHQYGTIIIVAGLFDIIEIKEGKWCLRRNSVMDTYNYLMSELRKAYLSVECLANSIMLCKLVGCDLRMCNERYACSITQGIIDNVVMLVNSAIPLLLAEYVDTTPQPEYAELVYERVNGTFNMCYELGLHDGMHFNENMMMSLTEGIYRALDLHMTSGMSLNDSIILINDE